MADRVVLYQKVGAHQVPYYAYRCEHCGRLFNGFDACRRHEVRDHP